MTRASDLARHQVAFKTALIEFTDEMNKKMGIE